MIHENSDKPGTYIWRGGKIDADQVIDGAFHLWGKIKIIAALFSGGYDSAVSTAIAWKYAQARKIPFVVVSLDTGLAADGWADYVRMCAKRAGWEHFFEGGDGVDWYERDVMENGFPHSPTKHRLIYDRLKGRGVEKALKRLKPDWFSQVLFVSGIRQSESVARSQLTSPWTRPMSGRSNGVFVNPIFWFREGDKLAYAVEHDIVLDNPFYSSAFRSGDCGCNWHCNLSVDDWGNYCPSRLEWMRQLDADARALHGYGYGEKPKRATSDEFIQMSMFDSNGLPVLCYGCGRRSSRRGLQDAMSNALDDIGWGGD